MKSNARIPRSLFTALAAVIIALFAVCSASAQGTLHFRNLLPPAINAPFTVGGAGVNGPDWRAEILIGPTAEQLAVAGEPAVFVTPGYVDGGVVSIPGMPSGSAVFAQIRAWNLLTGQTYASAAIKMASAVFPMTLGGDGTPPAELTGLGTHAIAIPEPAPSLLAAGVLVWVLLKRRQTTDAAPR